MPAVEITDGPSTCARDHRAVVLSCSHLARRWAALECRSAWLVVHCVSKNIRNIFRCNSRKHCQILIMFGTHVTKKVSNQYRGVYTRGEWCEMHHGENWGDSVMIMMLLLVSIIIYYYMNAFITLHQCTLNSAVSLLFYTVSQKNIPDVFSYNSRKYCRIFIILRRK